MGFLRRLLGGSADGAEAAGSGTMATDVSPTAGDETAGDEAARELSLRREDAARLADDLLQRQLRYADRSWTPPRQGGERRAGDDQGSGGS